MSGGGRPELKDFHCTTCGAGAGEACRSGRPDKRARGHSRRQDKYVRALNAWSGGAR